MNVLVQAQALRDLKDMTVFIFKRTEAVVDLVSVSLLVPQELLKAFFFF